MLNWNLEAISWNYGPHWTIHKCGNGKELRAIYNPTRQRLDLKTLELSWEPTVDLSDSIEDLMIQIKIYENRENTNEMYSK